MSNNQIILREATAAEVENWDEIVTRFENHRVTHTLAWIRSLEDAGKGRPLFLIYEKNGEIVGCLPGLITKIGLLRVFGSPLPGWQTRSMGPAFRPESVSTGEMLTPLVSFLETRYGVHHIELMNHHLEHKAMTGGGFRPEPRVVFRVPMFPGNEDRVLKNMKQNARNRIKNGVKLGLATKFIDDERFVEEVYEQLTEVYARGGNTIPFNKNRVQAFFRRMKQAGNLLAIAVYAPDSGICVATGLFTVGNKELILWSWSHRAEYRHYNATELMTWTVMKKAMEMGCTIFQLGGGSDFKAKFGAYQDSNKCRWVRSRYKWMIGARDIAEKCYRWQQSVRGRIAQRAVKDKFAPVAVNSPKNETVQISTERTN